MTRAEFIEVASPPCHECGSPVQRVETSWHLDEDAVWRLAAHMVCDKQHRVVVVPLV